MCHLPRENGDLTPPAKARKCPNRSHRTLAASSELQGLSLGWKSDLEDQKARSTARFAALCAASDLCISAPPPALQTRFHFALFQRCSDGLYWLSADSSGSRFPSGRFAGPADQAGCFQLDAGSLVCPGSDSTALSRPSKPPGRTLLSGAEQSKAVPELQYPGGDASKCPFPQETDTLRDSSAGIETLKTLQGQEAR